jgi:serine phosphatase RsbU (regulator of sigma subunit)
MQAQNETTATIEQLQQEMYRLYSSTNTEEFMDVTERLKEAALEAGEEGLFYRAWANQSSFIFSKISREKGVEIAKAMNEYSQQHDSKLGIYYSSITNANQASTLKMQEDALKLFKKAIQYKQQYLPDINAAAAYLGAAKVYCNTNQKEKVLEMADMALAEPDLIGSHIVDAWSYRCMAAMMPEGAIHKEEFNKAYKEWKKVTEEYKYNSAFSSHIEVYHAEVNGDYKKMLEIAKAVKSPLERFNLMTLAYEKQGKTKEALDCFKEYKRLSDSLNTAEIRRQTSEHTLQLDVIRAENQANELLLHNQTLKFWTAISVGLLAIVFLSIYLYRRSRHMKALATAYEQLEQTTAAKERIESELRIARDIQMSMVPSVFPEHKGLDIYASMTPAKEVGGDLYDDLLEDDTLYFCVGDVSGKGVPASLFMAQTTRLFRSLAKEHLMPAVIATRLNDELTEKNDNGMFVTMFIGQIDLTTGHLYYCNAGHNPPVIGDKEQHGSFLQMETNAPIGLWPGLEFIGEEIESIKGCPLLIYTDGLNEAEDTMQEQFGDDHLLDILHNTEFKNARQVVEMLKEEVIRHRNGAEANDDLTIMCIRI